MIRQLLPAILCAIPIAQAQSTYTPTVVHSFAPDPPSGARPDYLVRDSSGNIYGAAAAGGVWGHGTIYKVDPAGNLTVLHSFTGSVDGSGPGALLLDDAGNLYGTTGAGGACSVDGGCGLVYKLDASGQFSVLHSFGGKGDGNGPVGSLSRDAAGNLYGVTISGGADYMGIVYELSPSGTETILHNFAGGEEDGSSPTDLQLSSGDLYGTAECGGSGGISLCGADGAGIVFKLDPTGQETVLYSFDSLAGGADGSYAQSLTLDSAGNIYGTTLYGGIANDFLGGGVVFKLNPAGEETVLHAFAGGTADGTGPSSPVLLDSSGNLYGVTSSGGDGNCSWGGCGVVFRITPGGAESVLYAFAGAPDGVSPGGPVVRDSSGNLYVTASAGGVSNNGGLFMIDPAGNESVVYDFPVGQDGSRPEGGLVRDSSGNFYGATDRGGPADAGIVYKITADGMYTILYSFSGKSDGGNPLSAPIVDSAGNLYGTTFTGGEYSKGAVYSIDTNGNERVLYSFPGGQGGGRPIGPVFRDPAGNIYGTAFEGGNRGYGLLYLLSPSGQATVLHSFSGGDSDGAYPRSGLVADAAGNLFGTTEHGGGHRCFAGLGCGTVYKFEPSGKYSVLRIFQGGPDGATADAPVILDSSGNLYGTTYQGGNVACGYVHSCGVVYKLEPSGHETILYAFKGKADGCSPVGGLARDGAGNLYGTTLGCGSPANPNGKGVVFKVTPGGEETVLYTFPGEPGGNSPWSGVLLDSSGSLWGTTKRGGRQTVGIVYKLTPQ